MSREAAPDEGPTRHPAPGTRHSPIILCGLDRLGLRTLEELGRLGEAVTIVGQPESDEFLPEARRRGLPVVVGPPRDEATLRAAGIAGARALVLTDDDDLGNLHAALTAQELNPRLRVVVRMFNQELGQRIAGLFRDCTILSASAIAAPAFVAAALHHDWEGHLTVAGRLLTIEDRPARDPAVLLPLAALDAGGGVPEGDAPALFPPGDGDRLCLVDRGPTRAVAPGKGVKRRRLPHPGDLLAALGGIDRRLRWLVLVLLALLAGSTALFSRFAGLTPLDALAFTVTTVTTIEFSDKDLRSAPPALKVYGVALTLLGATALTLFYALITDAIVEARLNRLFGGGARRRRDHLVVCGLGTIGYRIVEQVVAAGERVAAVELREEGRFLPTARRLGVPTLVADARLPETLRALGVPGARCLIAATDDDVANLEIALAARDLNPGIRLVLRLFDPDFAARVERTLGLAPSRSVSALAAPAFAFAAAGRRILGTIPVGAGVLLVAQLTVAPGSRAASATIADLEAAGAARVLLATVAGRELWRPAGATRLAAGAEVVVVATRDGLARDIAWVEASG